MLMIFYSNYIIVIAITVAQIAKIKHFFSKHTATIVIINNSKRNYGKHETLFYYTTLYTYKICKYMTADDLFYVVLFSLSTVFFLFLRPIVYSIAIKRRNLCVIGPLLSSYEFDCVIE